MILRWCWLSFSPFFSICLVDLSSRITLSAIVIIESLPLVVIIIPGGFELEYRSSVLKEMLLPYPYLYTGCDQGRNARIYFQLGRKRAKIIEIILYPELNVNEK